MRVPTSFPSTTRVLFMDILRALSPTITLLSPVKSELLLVSSQSMQSFTLIEQQQMFMVLVHVLGSKSLKEGLHCNAGTEEGLVLNSSIFIAPQDSISAQTLVPGRIQRQNFCIAFIRYSLRLETQIIQFQSLLGRDSHAESDRPASDSKNTSTLVQP